MSDIKRLNIDNISGNFGLNPDKENFFFKPEGLQPFPESKPYRTETYGIGLVINGETKLRADLKDYVVIAPGIIMMGPEMIRQWFPASKPINVINVFFTEEFLLPGLSDSMFLKKFEYFGKSGIHFLSLNNGEFEKMNRLFKLIEEKKQSDSAFTYQVLRSYTQILLFEIEEIYQKQKDNSIRQLSQGELITRNFKDLLAKNFKEQRAVQYYADSLYINAKHLSQTLKEQTGKTASEWINEMVVLEAKVLLQNINLTINQIACQLNFADASFFGKFFKRNTGVSPKWYRNQN